MNNEQNIDDILKLLREKMNDPDGLPAESEEDNEDTSEHISTEDLQRSLKAQYSSEVSNDENGDEISPYDLDDGLLMEFSVTDEENDEDTGDEVIENSEDAVTEDSEEIEADVEETDGLCEDGEYYIDIDRTDAVSVSVAPTITNTAVLEITEDIDNELEIEQDEDLGDGDFDDELDTDFGEPISDNVEVEEPEKTVEIETDIEVPDEIFAEEIDFSDGDADTVGENADLNESAETDYEELETEDDAEPLTGEDVESFGEETEEDAFELDLSESTGDEGAKDEASEEDHPELRSVSFKSLMMDYCHSDPEPESESDSTEMTDAEEDEADTPDIGDIISDFVPENVSHGDSVNRSMHDLMSSLGCEDELKALPSEALEEMFDEYNGPIEDYDEIRSTEKKQRRRGEYKKNIILSAVRLALCGIAVVAAFFYDTLPIFGVEFFGLSDYTTYPGAYVMIGTQILLISAVCLWRPMLEGIKKLASFYPNIHSMAAVIVFMNVIYDCIFLINGNYEPETVPMFHFLSGTLLFAIACAQLVSLVREAKSFDIYSSDVTRFTLTRDVGKNSIANKMYSGGFSKNKSIYTPTPVAHPDGFTKAIREELSFGSKGMSSMIFLAVIICVIEAILLMILGRTPDEAAIAALTSIYALMPVAAVGAVAFPLCISSLRLTKRGIALTGSNMIRKYSEANVLVFNDLHLFTKCAPRDVGFVCYESSQTSAVMAALQILYSRIGGPLSETFSGVPDRSRAKHIRVRRVARTGVEALIDKSHILIVGDADFLRRYGIEFPKSEEKGRTNATVYISYDGKATAKLSAKYTVEPLFDMLIERLAKEGGHCVIETYDPMINTEFISRLRRKGHAPVSVVHKNAADINMSADEKPRRISDNGILAISSRLKLVEAVVWCARLCRIERITNIVVYSAAGLGFLLTMIAAAFTFTSFIWQFLILIYFALTFIAMLVITLCLIPKKNYFSVEALLKEELEKMNKTKER